MTINTSITQKDLLNAITNKPFTIQAKIVSSLTQYSSFKEKEKLSMSIKDVIDYDQDCNNCLHLSLGTTVNDALEQMEKDDKIFALVKDPHDKNIGLCTHLILCAVEENCRSDYVEKHMLEISKLISCKSNESLLNICTKMAKSDINYILLLRDDNQIECVVSCELLIKLVFGHP